MFMDLSRLGERASFCQVPVPISQVVASGFAHGV